MLDCKKKKFWVENITNLFCDFTILPLDNMKLSEKMNALTRFIILITIILLLINFNHTILFFLVSILFIIILYYIQTKQIEKFIIFDKYNKEESIMNNNFDENNSSFHYGNIQGTLRKKGGEMEEHNLRGKLIFTSPKTNSMGSLLDYEYCSDFNNHRKNFEYSIFNDYDHHDVVEEEILYQIEYIKKIIDDAKKQNKSEDFIKHLEEQLYKNKEQLQQIFLQKNENDSKYKNKLNCKYKLNNKKLFGKANPKTSIPPIIPPRLTDLEVWKYNNNNVHYKINESNKNNNKKIHNNINNCFNECSENNTCDSSLNISNNDINHISNYIQNTNFRNNNDLLFENNRVINPKSNNNLLSKINSLPQHNQQTLNTPFYNNNYHQQQLINRNNKINQIENQFGKIFLRR